MRVGIGTILSVLSSSVLAAVIPSYDHGPLLARRAVSLESKSLLWKRAGEKQAVPVPSNSDAGASTETGTGVGKSNPNSFSINSVLSKMGQFQQFIDGLYKSRKKNWSTRKQIATLKKDEKSLQNAAKRVTEVTEGVSKGPFDVEVDKFLRTAVNGARSGSELYDNKTVIPFFLSVTEDSNQKSLLKGINKMQSRGKKYAKKHLVDVLRSTNDIIKHPQNVIAELEKITSSISHMFMALTVVSGRDYNTLVAKVNPKDNKENIEITKDYMLQMKNHRDSAFKAVNAIKEEITKGKVTFKGKTQSRFGAFKSGVKRRLRLKSKSSTDVTPNQEET
ncbi:hypothetical protein BASA50_010538 [Batrachochytrium salamandrivorans]|uniref:Uncharacterized protein n=1 Tax=Batrachochytrium salamandrivorans TaxID=1357716 RepID=A0ABQ8EYC0_9FUNG|nr:hypothetical protein BASA50_010538 [Batrachochytrium salamandrivorans]